LARDKHYGEWLTIWNELTQTSEKADGYNAMIGNVAALTVADQVTPLSTPAATLYIPLQFWFCKNPGLALPLIALQYHEVKFNITFRAASDCYIVDGATASPSLSNASLFVDYIYLDTDERRQFSQVQHEYLLSKRKKVTTLARADTVLRKKCMYSAQPNVLPVVYCC
jgi:hypothetical protein